MNDSDVACVGTNNVRGPSGGLIGGDATQLLEIDGRTMHGAPDWKHLAPPTIFGSQQRGAK
jgi:hypothetical protein